MGKFVVSVRNNGEFQFKHKASNGQVIGAIRMHVSENYNEDRHRFSNEECTRGSRSRRNLDSDNCGVVSADIDFNAVLRGMALFFCLFGDSDDEFRRSFGEIADCQPAFGVIEPEKRKMPCAVKPSF